jgi:hypothetical protein
VLLALGAVWLIVAIVLYRTSFVFTVFKWQGGHISVLLFRVLLWLMPNLIFLGWVVPVLLGSWLLWKK